MLLVVGMLLLVAATAAVMEMVLLLMLIVAGAANHSLATYSQKLTCLERIHAHSTSKLIPTIKVKLN